MVQKIEKYIKLHVLGDFGDIWFGISEDIQKIDFSSSWTEILIPWKFDVKKKLGLVFSYSQHIYQN